MQEKSKKLLNRIIVYSKSYIEICIWLFFFAIGIRFFETILLSYTNGGFFTNLRWNFIGLFYDCSLYLRFGWIALIVFIAICFFSEKVARTIVRILLSLMLLLSLICIGFYATSGFLLDKVIFNYSIKETISIIKSSSSSPIWVYATVFLLPILFFFISGIRIKVKTGLKINLKIYALIIFIFLTVSSFFLFKKLSPNIEQYHVKENKEYFFWKSILKKQETIFKETDEEIIKAVEEFRSYFPNHKFEGVEYPFFYKDSCKDVLSSFFNLNQASPNLVFVIIEGLGYNLFKNDYQLMPFLDSLSKNSLTWEHCLSASERTFGVLPAIFGALPLGKTGFLDEYRNALEYYSLLKILHQNEYVNNFFYGSWIGFDYMEHFLNKNNATYFNDNDWDEDITNQKQKDSEFSWGYDDHLMYLQALRKLNKEQSSKRLDIYLSVSTHGPWKYPNATFFQNIVKDKVTQNNKLSNQQKNNILNLIKEHGSFAYSDWAIQQLMNSYKERDDYYNTIFIITGDHNVFAKQFGGYSNFHVPLIIYSPMLKSCRNMKGVVSHRDIIPSFLSLLQNNFNINVPDKVAWLNTSLDTSLTFNANSFSPLQLIDHSLGGIMYKNYMLCEGVLEELVDGGSYKIENYTVLQQMNRLLSLYKFLDSYIIKNDALLESKYAHNDISKKTIIDIEDSITEKSYFTKKSKLPIVEGPDGHNTTLYFDTANLYPIQFVDFEVPDDIEKFKVEIEFKNYVRNNEKKDLIVVMQIPEAYYNIDYISYYTHNQWNTYQNTLTLKKEVWEKAKKRRFEIFLWNPSNLEGYIDDIKIKIITY